MSFNLVTTIHSWEDLLNFRNPERVSEDPENYERCIFRERGEELELAKKEGLRVIYAMPDTSQGIIRTSGFHIERNEYQLWDAEGIPAENTTGPAIIRAHAGNEFQVTKTVEEAGMTPLTSNRDNQFASKWIDWVLPAFLPRKTGRLTMREVLDGKAQPYADKKGRVFIKTENKKISGVCQADNTIEVIEYNCSLLPSDTPFLVSEPLDILADEHGTREWRIWMLDGKPTSFSRYLDYITDYTTPDDVRKYAEEFGKTHDIPPRAYILDVAETTTGVQIIEINPQPASGRYGNNDFSAFLKPLLS